MARRSGTKGVILADLTTTGTGTLTTVTYAAKWSINMTRNKINVTALGDTSIVNVVDLPDQAIQIDGFSDLGVTVLGRLLDGVPRGVTVIPDNTNNPAVTFSGGTYYGDGTISGGQGEAVAFTLTMSPASSGAWTTGI